MSSIALHFFKTQLTGSTINNLSLDTLRNTYFPIPSQEEQSTISSYLDEKMGRIDSAISNATKQISLLQERKQIIINDVVTGKVKII